MKHTVSSVITDDELNAIIQIESGGRPTIKASTSSATGLGQFLAGTWRGVVAKHKPDWAEGLSDKALLALRLDPVRSIEMLARFTEDNAKALGRGYSPGDLYLAHFLGTGDARKVFRADAGTPMSSLVSAAVIKANKSILQGKNAGQVRAWAERKMKTNAGHDWIAKYWTEEPIDSGEDEEPVKVDTNDEDEEDVTPHGQQNTKIEKLQRDLDGLGYHEVGLINAKWGGGTKAALAAFLNDRGIDGVADMRTSNLKEVQDAIAEGWMRPIAEERKDIKPKELAKDNVTVRQGLRAKLTAMWTGAVSVVIGIGSSIADKFSDYWQALATPRKILSEVPLPVWVALVAGVCGAVWWMNRDVVDDTTDKFKTRKLLQ